MFLPNIGNRYMRVVFWVKSVFSHSMLPALCQDITFGAVLCGTKKRIVFDSHMQIKYLKTCTIFLNLRF